jgi:hypothetical protein
MDYKPRTAQEILDDLLTEKASRPALDVLTNPSDTSVWYNELGVFAVQTAALEELGVVLFNDVDSRAQEIPPGTIFWYAAETLKYQNGDSLIIGDNGIPQYAVIDESKQIITSAAAIEQSGGILVKCAKEVGGVTQKLSAGELSGVQQYWLEKRVAGAPLSIVSTDPDLIRSFLRVQVDGQRIGSDGQSLSSPGTYPVEEAILAYYSQLNFNGIFSVMDLIDSIQAVEGTGNVSAQTVEAKADASSTWVNITDQDDKTYIAVAGYLTEDPANLLRDTITYYL